MREGLGGPRRLPYQITYHMRGDIRIETAAADTASVALSVIEELERLNDIVDEIIAPDGQRMRIYQLMIAADREKRSR